VLSRRAIQEEENMHYNKAGPSFTAENFFNVGNFVARGVVASAGIVDDGCQLC
jgi:hypothetical protein